MKADYIFDKVTFKGQTVYLLHENEEQHFHVIKTELKVLFYQLF